MNEIVPDVLTWSRRSERHGYDFNSHLVRHPEGNLCIDPVEPSEAVLDQIAGIGATRILLTNRNHTRAANLLRSRLGARTAIHPKDADYARSQGAEIDDSFDVGERIGPLQVIGIPGKSPGEVGSVLAGAQAADRRRRGDRQSARTMRALAGKGDGRSCPAQAEPPNRVGARLRHTSHGRRIVDCIPWQRPPERAGGELPRLAPAAGARYHVRFKWARARHRREKGGDASRHALTIYLCPTSTRCNGWARERTFAEPSDTQSHFRTWPGCAGP